MAVQDFHQAALVLQGACQAIERLLDETEPLERAYHREMWTLDNAGADNEAMGQLSEESGYGAFHLAAMRLSECFYNVEQIASEEMRRHLGAA